MILKGNQKSSHVSNPERLHFWMTGPKVQLTQFQPHRRKFSLFIEMFEKKQKHLQKEKWSVVLCYYKCEKTHPLHPH
jgi:hypothetical protein